MGARFSAPVQTGPGAHPDSCTMGARSFPGVKSGRGMTLIPHPFLVPWSYFYSPCGPYGLYRVSVPVQGCTLPFLPYTVVQVVETLCCKPEGCGFDSRWCRNFSSTQSFRPHFGPEADSASNRNEYQEYFLGGKGIGLTTLPPSCADCLEIWESEPPGTLRACPGL